MDADQAVTDIKDKFPPSNHKKGVCQVPGCGVDITGEKTFYRRSCICAVHAAAEEVSWLGKACRFCQQCGRLHDLSFFDGSKRSCREQLAKHNLARKQERAERKQAKRFERIFSDASQLGSGMSSGAKELLAQALLQQQQQQQQQAMLSAASLDQLSPGRVGLQVQGLASNLSSLTSNLSSASTVMLLSSGDVSKMESGDSLSGRNSALLAGTQPNTGQAFSQLHMQNLAGSGFLGTNLAWPQVELNLGGSTHNAPRSSLSTGATGDDSMDVDHNTSGASNATSGQLDALAAAQHLVNMQSVNMNMNMPMLNMNMPINMGNMGMNMQGIQGVQGMVQPMLVLAVPSVQLGSANTTIPVILQQGLTQQQAFSPVIMMNGTQGLQLQDASGMTGMNLGGGPAANLQSLQAFSAAARFPSSVSAVVPQQPSKPTQSPSLTDAGSQKPATPTPAASTLRSLDPTTVKQALANKPAAPPTSSPPTVKTDDLLPTAEAIAAADVATIDEPPRILAPTTTRLAAADVDMEDRLSAPAPAPLTAALPTFVAPVTTGSAASSVSSGGIKSVGTVHRDAPASSGPSVAPLPLHKRLLKYALAARADSQPPPPPSTSKPVVVKSDDILPSTEALLMADLSQ